LVGSFIVALPPTLPVVITVGLDLVFCGCCYGCLVGCLVTVGYVGWFTRLVTLFGWFGVIGFGWLDFRLHVAFNWLLHLRLHGCYPRCSLYGCCCCCGCVWLRLPRWRYVYLRWVWLPGYGWLVIYAFVTHVVTVTCCSFTLVDVRCYPGLFALVTRLTFTCRFTRLVWLLCLRFGCYTLLTRLVPLVALRCKFWFITFVGYVYVVVHLHIYTVVVYVCLFTLLLFSCCYLVVEFVVPTLRLRLLRLLTRLRLVTGCCWVAVTHVYVGCWLRLDQLAVTVAVGCLRLLPVGCYTHGVAPFTVNVYAVGIRLHSRLALRLLRCGLPRLRWTVWFCPGYIGCWLRLRLYTVVYGWLFVARFCWTFVTVAVTVGTRCWFVVLQLTTFAGWLVVCGRLPVYLQLLVVGLRWTFGCCWFTTHGYLLVWTFALPVGPG